MADMEPETLPDQPSTPTPPADGRPRARATDPLTSHEAAETARNTREIIYERCLAIVAGHAPVTSDEVIRWFGVYRWKGSPSGIRSRLSEAVADGKLRISPEAGVSALGRRAQQYEVAE